MHANEQRIHDFYTAFQRQDAAAMNGCYAPDVAFTDPAFQTLHGNEARAMWEMLCARAKDLTVTFRDVQADDKTGRAHWEATYTFRTGRKVHNVIDATFEFRDGLIVRHTDHFDLWKWAGMALGPVGMLLGWTPFVQSKIRRTAREGLDEYLAKKG